MNVSIDFYKTTSWGGTVTEAFTFIRNHLRTFLLANLMYVFPFFLLSSVLSITLEKEVSYGYGSFANIFPYSGSTIFALFIVYILGASSALTINGNIVRTAFLSNNQKVTIQDARTGYWKGLGMNALYLLLYVFMLFLFLIGIYIILIIGSFLFIAISSFLGAIGIVFGVLFIFIFYSLIASYTFSVLGLIFAIQHIEQKGIFEAVGRNFQLVHYSKKNFWGAILSSFLILIVLQILNLSLSWPILLISFIVEFVSGYTPTTLIGVMGFISKMSVFSSISSMITIPLWGIALYTSLAFLYFNLSERSDARGLKKRIQEIGQKPDFDKNAYNELA